MKFELKIKKSYQGKNLLLDQLILSNKREKSDSMKIVELEIIDFMGIKNLKITNPTDVVVLIGPNGSGKSSVLKALNTILGYCFGYFVGFNGDIRIDLDLHDHIDSIKDWFNNLINDSSFIDKIYLRNYQHMFNNYVEIKKFLEFFINSIIPSFESNPIISIKKENFQIKSQVKEYQGQTSLFEYFKDKDNSYFYAWLVFDWLNTRSKGNDLVPGVAFLDLEKMDFRNSSINPSELPQAYSQRINNLYNPSWRAMNLGSRLINLVLLYNRRKLDLQENDDSDPVTRINNSLLEFVPHLQLISPLPADNILKFKVRGNEVPLNLLSSGELSLVNYAIDYLELEINGGVILIDEPSTHLHYDLQTRLISFLQHLIGEENKPLIWVATHSPPIINSVSKDSIFVIDLDDEKEPVKNLEKSKDSVFKKQILTLLGQSHYFDRRPILYVEGESDIAILENVINKIEPELLNKYKFHKVNGSGTAESMIASQKKLLEISERISSDELRTILSQNYYLLDNDNTRSENEFPSYVFVWDFYHLENLLFQEPFFDQLTRIMKSRTNLPTDEWDSTLEKAIRTVYERKNHLKNNYSIDDLLKDDLWKKYMKGRDLFKEWKNVLKISAFSVNTAFEKMLEFVTSTDDITKELKELVDWLDDSYNKWISMGQF